MASTVLHLPLANIKTCNGNNGNDENTEVTIHSEKDPSDETQTDTTTAATDTTTSKCRVCWKQFVVIYWQNEFLFLVVIALLLAKAYPPLGAVYLVPQITASWIAVIIIFFVAGLGIRTEAFHEAIKRVRFNLFVQCFNFGFVSVVVFGLSRAVIALGLISNELANGVLITSCLSMSVGLVAILTRACNGDEAAAVFNQAVGNMVGVFLSPTLILGYLGVLVDINLGEVFFKLSMRVVVPAIVGQVVQKSHPFFATLGTKYRRRFTQGQEYSLLYIIYCTFCKIFLNGSGNSLGQVFATVLYILLQLLLLMVIAWYLLRFFWRDEPSLRVMGLFGCTHKTIGMGVPLVTAMYENDPNLAQYILPILIWHPTQLIIGSLLTHRLSNFIIKEKERLGIMDDDDDINNKKGNGNDDDEEAQEKSAGAVTHDCNTTHSVSDSDAEDNKMDGDKN